MGKYDIVIGNLSAAPPEEPAYQSKIDALKKAMKAADTHTPETLAREYVSTREIKEELADDLSVVQMRLTALEQMLVESVDNDEPGWGMYGAGPTTVKMPDGGSVAVQYEPTGKVEDKEAFRLWCINNGLENALQLHNATMNALVKERLLNGQPEPDGVKAYVRSKIVLRRG